MKTKTTEFLLIFIISGVVFFALTLPFHRILAVFTLSEVRPAAVLYPFLGISFGWPAILGMMVANFISDAMNGYPAAVLFESVIPQILYSLVPYLMWCRLTKGEDHIHRLDSVNRVMRFVLVCLVSALLSGIGVALIVKINFGAEFLSVFSFVVLNNFDVSIILGCPLMIVSNQIISRRRGTERIVTLNEKILLISAAVEVVGLAVLVISMYKGGATIGTYDTWNSIYLCALVLVNIILLLSLVVMICAERKTLFVKLVLFFKQLCDIIDK